MAVFIFTVDVLNLFSFDEKYTVHMHYAAMRQSIKIPFFVWSLRFLHTNISHKLTRQKRGGGGAGEGSLRSISPI